MTKRKQAAPPAPVALRRVIVLRMPYTPTKAATVVMMIAELRITVEAVAAPTMAIVMPTMKTAVSAKAKLRVLVREASEACSERMD